MFSFAHFILIFFFLPCFTQTHTRSFGLPLNPTLIVHLFFSYSYSYKFQSRQSFPFSPLHPLTPHASSIHSKHPHHLHLPPASNYLPPLLPDRPLRLEERIVYSFGSLLEFVYILFLVPSLFLSLFLVLSKKILLFSFFFVFFWWVDVI